MIQSREAPGTIHACAQSSPPASRSGSAVGVFGVSFGVGAVSAGATVAAGLRDVAAGVHRRVAVLGGQRDRRRWFDGVGARWRAVAGRAQRRVRLDDGASARPVRSAKRLVAAQLTIDESTAMATAQDDPTRSAPRSGSPGSASTCSGTSGTLLGALLAAPSIRRRSGSTPRSRPASSRCCGRCCATGRGRLAAAIGAAICLALIPVRAGRHADPLRLVGGAGRRAADDAGRSILLLRRRRVRVQGARAGGDRRPHAAAGARALPQPDPGRADRGADREGHVQRRPAPAARRSCRRRRRRGRSRPGARRR